MEDSSVSLEKPSCESMVSFLLTDLVLGHSVDSEWSKERGSRAAMSSSW